MENESGLADQSEQGPELLCDTGYTVGSMLHAQGELAPVFAPFEESSQLIAKNSLDDATADELSVAIRVKPSTLSDFLAPVQRCVTNGSALSTLFAQQG